MNEKLFEVHVSEIEFSGIEAKDQYYVIAKDAISAFDKVREHLHFPDDYFKIRVTFVGNVVRQDGDTILTEKPI